jgi:hypothetical protein
LLELVALGALGWLGFQRGPGPWRWVLAAALPIVAITLWGVFNVPGDPSRGGGAPVVVPGWLRLGVEALVLGGAAAALLLLEHRLSATIFVTLTLLHYALSLDRLRWLIER